MVCTSMQGPEAADRLQQCPVLTQRGDTALLRHRFRATPGNGQKQLHNCSCCPVTTSVLEQIQPAIDLAMRGGGECLFSVVKAGTRLRPHCGSTNARLTCHLGLVIPSACLQPWLASAASSTPSQPF